MSQFEMTIFLCFYRKIVLIYGGEIEWRIHWLENMEISPDSKKKDVHLKYTY